MDVFVLMEDGGYDGDLLLGAFSTRDKAEVAAKEWRDSPDFAAGNSTYVCVITLDSSPEAIWNDEARSVK